MEEFWTSYAIAVILVCLFHPHVEWGGLILVVVPVMTLGLLVGSLIDRLRDRLLAALASVLVATVALVYIEFARWRFTLSIVAPVIAVGTTALTALVSPRRPSDMSSFARDFLQDGPSQLFIATGVALISFRQRPPIDARPF